MWCSSASLACSLENLIRVAPGLLLGSSFRDGQVSELRNFGACVCDFCLIRCTVENEGRVYSDGVIQPGFVSPAGIFLVAVRREAGGFSLPS